MSLYLLSKGLVPRNGGQPVPTASCHPAGSWVSHFTQMGSELSGVREFPEDGAGMGFEALSSAYRQPPRPPARATQGVQLFHRPGRRGLGVPFGEERFT